jgi:hypothetical protein
MNPFGKLSTEGLAENEDRAGGGFSPLETDVYEGVIKVAYAGQSKEGAHNVSLILQIGTQEHRETIYVTNKAGENFFLSKTEKDAAGKPKKVALPGFTTIDDLCQVSVGKTLSEADVEEKVLKIYDYDTRQEVPKSVPVLTELTGKPCLVAIKKSLVNKKGPAPTYEPIADYREENTIEKVFHPELRVTVVEAKKSAEKGEDPKAEFIDVWLEKNKGRTHDKRQVKDGEAGKSGRPSAGPPQAGGQSGAPKRSLFGNKNAA